MSWSPRRRHGYGKQILSNGCRADRYGKTVRFTTKYKRKKCKENRRKFEMGTEVVLDGRSGKLVDSYIHENVIFYRIEWDEPRATWYDKLIGQEPSRYGWCEARFIRRKDGDN